MEKTMRRFSEDISTETSMHKSKRLRSSISFGGEDIYTEILLRLPVISILNLRTVSKLWLSIVSSHRFRQTHASRRHRLAATGLIFPVNQFITYGLLQIKQQQQQPKIIFTTPVIKRPDDCMFMRWTCTSSCNGLQLFKSPMSKSPDHIYYVYNPTTGNYKQVLDIPPYISKNKFVSASLAFYPYESLDYKVVFLWRRYEFSNNFQLEVYSSSTGTCKAPVNNTFVGDFEYDDNCGIFCNGAIHWLSSDATYIVYFNVHTECIKRLKTPRLACKIHYFGESHCHLHLVNSNHQHFYKSPLLFVSELKGDYSGWFLKHQVDLSSIVSALPHQVYPIEDHGTFMSIFRDEEEDDVSTIVLLACNQWVEYNFKKKTTKRLCKFALPELYTSHFPWSYGLNTYQFIPTLMSI